MTNMTFGQLVLANTNPTREQRENVARNRLGDIQHNQSYLRVHAVAVTNSTSVYAAVSFNKDGERVLSYVAGSIQCRRKREGYWLEFDCFMATKSVPFYLNECPPEIFIAGSATNFPVLVDAGWIDSCTQMQKEQDNAKALKRGAIFTLEHGKPATILAGEFATFAVILNKRRALFIEPLSGTTKEGDTDSVLQNYNPIPTSSIPTMAEEFGHSETGELLFDLSGSAPVLKGRLAKGVNAQRLVRDHKRRDQALSEAIRHHDFAAKFQSGDWLA